MTDTKPAPFHAANFDGTSAPIGRWDDGPETFVIIKAKDVQLGTQTYDPVAVPPTPSQTGAVTELEVQLSKVLRGASGVADLAVISNRYVDEWKDWDEQRKKALAAFEAKKAGA